MNSDRLLAILIPTYNREFDLKNNLVALINIIEGQQLENKVKIIISDNCSADETQKLIQTVKSQTKVNIEAYLQNVNIGLQQNALFVLEKADTDYVMYLGDDDYISKEYLVNLINKLEANPAITCIIPSFKGIYPTGEVAPYAQRDLRTKSRLYEKGYKSAIENSWRGHQLSGIVLKREGTLKSYLNQRVNNIYPFIYFVALNCLRGKVWHFTEYPILVTQPGQEKKDWGYGDDGLLSEILDNYKKIQVPLVVRARLEAKMFRVQEWRYQMYLYKSLKSYLIAVIKIEFGSNISMLGRLIFPIIVLGKLAGAITRKLARKIAV